MVIYIYKYNVLYRYWNNDMEIYIIDVRYPLSKPCTGIIMKLFCSPKSVNHPRPPNHDGHVWYVLAKKFFNTERTEDSGDSTIRVQICAYHNVCMCISVCVCVSARSKNLISWPAVIANKVHTTYTLIIILRHCKLYDTRARF